jgi:hypothetical protein
VTHARGVIKGTFYFLIQILSNKSMLFTFDFENIGYKNKQIKFLNILKPRNFSHLKTFIKSCDTASMIL